MTNPRDDLMALADRIANHRLWFAAQPLRMSHDDWRSVSRDWLDAAAALRLAASRPAEPVEASELLTPEEAWQNLIEMTDRTSPEEYPDHALISFEELKDFMLRATTPNAVGEPVAWQWWDSKFAEWRSCSKFSFDNWEKYPHIKRRELYTHPPKSPDISAEEMRERCAARVEQFGQPYALNTNSGAMMFRAEVSKIATAIRQLPTTERGDK